MGSKKANSTLPSELNEDWGSNYMMDGFWHDMEYEHGLRENPARDPVPQPSTSGFAQLPGALIVGDEETEPPQEVEQEALIDLEALGIVASVDPDVDRSDVGVVDFSWIGEARQDLDRLPNQPVDNGIPELQEAWGDRTDGIHRIDLYDRDETHYEDADQRKEDDDRLNREKLAGLVGAAMRRSAAGDPLQSIKADLAAHVDSEDVPKIVRAVRAVEAEHGLVGNVYVRASAYPGLHKGRHREAMQRAAKGARYLVAHEGCDCTDCACALGLRVVDHANEIDWNDAYEHYAPQLEATGRLDRMATIMDKRESLRRAFLAHEVAPRLAVESTKVRPTMPADRVSSEEARAALAALKTGERETLTNEAREHAVVIRNLGVRLGALVKASLITQEEADRLFKSEAPAEMRLRMAHLLAARTKRASYSGASLQDARVRISAEQFARAAADASRHEHMARTASAAEGAERLRLLEGFRRVEARYEQARRKFAQVLEAVEKGDVKGAALRKMVDGLFDGLERRMVAFELDPVLARNGYYEQSEAPRDYQDAAVREAVPARHEPVVSAGEVSGAVRWTRRQMSEGAAGRELDRLLRARFEPRVMKAASEKIAAARREHEGLSGHLYADAGAYATRKTAKGCEEGGLRHRANGLKYVLAMPRCEGCVFKNADGVCQKYNKVLADEFSGDDVEQLRRRTIASHEMTDQEQTAAMFAVGTQAADEATRFGLHNAMLDDVETEEPEHGLLDGIFFGGFEI